MSSLRHLTINEQFVRRVKSIRDDISGKIDLTLMT